MRVVAGFFGAGVATGSGAACSTIGTGVATVGAAVWMEEQIWQRPDSCSAAVWVCAKRSVAANSTMQAQSTASAVRAPVSPELAGFAANFSGFPVMTCVLLLSFSIAA